MKNALGIALFSLGLGVAPGALAQPFSQGDPVLGKQMHEESCISCHHSMIGPGRGNELYTSEIRKVDSARALSQRVVSCAAQMDLGWFDEDSLHVTRFLNDSFYKFKE